jgi:alpha-ribazole phosphatase
MTRLILVRHGEPEASAHGRCYGRLDVALSPRGRAQAVSLARFLGHAQLDAVYSSPSQRALETARPLARAHALEVSTDGRLREIDFGAVEGLTWDEIRAREPTLFSAWMRRPTEVSFPGGESFAELQARVLDGARALLSQHAGETIALFLHAGPARVLLADALGLAPANLFRIDLSHAGVSVIDHLDGTQVVRLINGGPRDVCAS